MIYIWTDDDPTPRELPIPCKFDWQFSDLDRGSGRNDFGLMMRERIGSKVKLTLIWNPKKQNRKIPFSNFRSFQNTIYNINLHIAFLISNMTIGLDPYRNHMRDHLLAIEIGRKNMTHCLFLIKKSIEIPLFFTISICQLWKKRCRILTAKMRGVFLVFVVF